MQLAAASGTRPAFSRVSAVLDIPRSSLYYQKAAAKAAEEGYRPRRRGPKRHDDSYLLDLIKIEIKKSMFHDEGYRKIWARLHFQEVPVSKGRVLRIMRENNLLAGKRHLIPDQKKEHKGKIIPDHVDTMWGADMTQICTLEGTASIFVVVDHYSQEILGIHAALIGNRFEALESIRQAIRTTGRRYGALCLPSLVLRHDNGSQYISRDFQNELRYLGIKSSPSFPYEPQCNGCSERMMKTLKENLLWLKKYKNVDELNTALRDFKAAYNANWMCARHGYRSPSWARQFDLQRQHEYSSVLMPKAA